TSPQITRVHHCGVQRVRSQEPRDSSGDAHRSIIEDRILESEIKSNGLWAILPKVVVLFPVLREAVRIFLCQKLVQMLSVVTSKVVPTCIVRNRRRALFCLWHTFRVDRVVSPSAP